MIQKEHRKECIKLLGISVLGVGFIIFGMCGQNLVSPDMLGLTLIMGIMTVTYGFLGMIFAMQKKIEG